MKQKILIANESTGAYALSTATGSIVGAVDLDLLTEGCVALLTEAGLTIPASGTAAVVNDVERVMIAVGGPVGKGARLSQPIDRRRVRIEKRTYSAPVAQVSVIGSDGSTGALNMPTLVTDDIVGIKIIDESAGTQPAIKKEYIEYQALASDTNATMITKLIAKINSVSTLVTAVVVGSQAGITLTAKNTGKKLSFAVFGNISNATIATTTNPFAGVGTYAQIAAMEADNDVEEGNTNQVYMPSKWFNRAKTAVSGNTYVQYTLMIDQLNEGVNEVRHVGTHELVLAVKVGATQITNLETVLGVVFGSAFTVGSSGGAEAGV